MGKRAYRRNDLPGLLGLHFAGRFSSIQLVKATLSTAVKDEATSWSLMFYLSVTGSFMYGVFSVRAWRLVKQKAGNINK